MEIRNISHTKPSFKGTVFMNYNKIASEIDNCPYSTQESIIGNIKTLKDRLETQTPDYKTYLIDFDYKTYRESKIKPTQHIGIIKVTDENKNFAQNEFLLGKSGGSRREDKTQLASGQEIWDNGFKEITDKSISGLSNYAEPTADYEELRKKSGGSESVFQQLKEIYDKIEDRARVEIDKVKTTTSIFEITSDGCPDEIRESIIGNLNTLSWRLEKETSKEKQYSLIIDNEIYGHGYASKYSNGAAYVTVRTNGSYEREYLPTRKCDFEDVTPYYYCITYPERIYSKTFKPLTEKILWDGHHYLPFDDDYKKREIVNKLS